jgi:4-amino-4-deoxy-L-arabinose transferase-like glycosyltransferase
VEDATAPNAEDPTALAEAGPLPDREVAADKDEAVVVDDEPRFSGTDWLGLTVVILVIAAALRLHDLDRNPPEFFEDELSGAVSAWSIVTTGHDVERTTLPFLRTRLELKQPIYGFSTVPFWAVLGHTPFAARLPAVIFGLVTIVLVIWLMRILGRDPPEAILAAAILAILPWAVHYSRVGWEPSSLLPFSIGGIGLLWIGLRDGRRLFVVAAAGVLAFGAYSYHPALLMNVVLALLVTVLFARQLTRRDVASLAIGAALALVILVPYGLAALRDPLFTSRTATISVFSDGLTLDALGKAWDDYWVQWDPGFLLGGGAINPRINPGAVLFWWMVPTFLVGMDLLLHRRSRPDWLLLGWLILGPLPGALTADRTTPHFARGLLAMPPIVMITAMGTLRAVAWVERLRRGAILRGAFALGLAMLALFQGVTYYQDYFDDYPTRSANWWGYGSGAALQLVGTAVPPGGTVCIATNDISGFTFPHQVLYWLGTPPFTVVEGVKDARCRSSGTFILAFASRTLDVPVTALATVPDASGKPLFQLSVVTQKG